MGNGVFNVVHLPPWSKRHIILTVCPDPCEGIFASNSAMHNVNTFKHSVSFKKRRDTCVITLRASYFSPLISLQRSSTH